MNKINRIRTPLEINLAKRWFNFFKRIPDRNWCVGNLKKGSRSCAIGHITNSSDTSIAYKHPDVVRLDDLLEERVYEINDEPRVVGHRTVISPRRNTLRALARIVKGKH